MTELEAVADGHTVQPPAGARPAAAEAVFGDRAELAARYVELLTEHGVARGLIGPREQERLWDRHVLNSAVLGELIEQSANVIDVGSGAGLPGIPLAIARPDLRLVLLEPMERRVAWLHEVADTLGLEVTIVRGRAEDIEVRRQWHGADVVTARAVAPLDRLARWCLPLLRPHGRLLALKGAAAAEEIATSRAAVLKAGGRDLAIAQCGAELLAVPTTVVTVLRDEPRGGRRPASRAQGGRAQAGPGQRDRSRTDR